MTWDALLDAFVLDKRAENRMSQRTEEAYRHVVGRFFAERPVKPEKATKRITFDAAELLACDAVRAAYADVLGLREAA